MANMILRLAPILTVEANGSEFSVCNICELPDDEDNPLPHKHLVLFNPPVCGVCHQEMRNVQTIDGKRRFGCVTWGCTNHRTYDEEGNRLGQNPGDSRVVGN